MLIAITRPHNIRAAQKVLEDRLKHELRERRGPFTIGFQGGDVQVESVWSNDSFWFAHRLDRDAKIPRFWNAFGLAATFGPKISNTITVEVNIALEGMTRRVAGLFATESVSKRTLLLHSGRVGGGHKNVGMSSFLGASSSPQVSVSTDQSRQKSSDYVVVADLSSSEFVKQLGHFVADVAAFKAHIKERELQQLSDEALLARARKARKHPPPMDRLTSQIPRDNAVTLFAKRRAGGQCDLCGNRAPFIDKMGQPFLECHHIDWLARGGADAVDNAVALCPNCHRRMHVIDDEKDKAKLKAKATRGL
jgi:5-methylcytosine-specific restriction protein A